MSDPFVNLCASQRGSVVGSSPIKPSRDHSKQAESLSCKSQRYLEIVCILQFGFLPRAASPTDLVYAQNFSLAITIHYPSINFPSIICHNSLSTNHMLQLVECGRCPATLHMRNVQPWIAFEPGSTLSARTQRAYSPL